MGSNGFATVKMRKSLKGKEIKATKDGYKPGEYKIGTKLQPWFFGNLILGGIPGMAIDVATGKMMKYKNTMLDVTLQPIPGYGEEEVVEEVVVPFTPEPKKKSSDNDVENAILRWHMDSDPRGARVFWRVISSVPNEVPNTNETYLTTTPIEETRSFNIHGLNYDNARDVTIEIKVSKRGYEDQIKRYNVRQALDQQEISGFFELVKKDN